MIHAYVFAYASFLKFECILSSKLSKGAFEDYFPFPNIGYVSFLEINFVERVPCIQTTIQAFLIPDQNISLYV